MMIYLRTLLKFDEEQSFCQGFSPLLTAGVHNKEESPMYTHSIGNGQVKSYGFSINTFGK